MRKEHKPPLTEEERAEKERLRAVYMREKANWKTKHGEKLTQERLGVLVGELMDGKPMTQGAVWQYLTPTNNTRLNPGFVQAFCMVLGADIREIGERFIPIWVKEGSAAYEAADIQIMGIAKRLRQEGKEKMIHYGQLLLLSEEGK